VVRFFSQRYYLFVCSCVEYSLPLKIRALNEIQIEPVKRYPVRGVGDRITGYNLPGSGIL
jgi:hypothetical protein